MSYATCENKRPLLRLDVRWMTAGGGGAGQICVRGCGWSRGVRIEDDLGGRNHVRRTAGPTAVVLCGEFIQ